VKRGGVTNRAGDRDATGVAMMTVAVTPVVGVTRGARRERDDGHACRRREVSIGALVAAFAPWMASESSARANEARVFVPFDGKSAAAVAFDVPETWVRAIDRPFDARAPPNGATIAMVGDFKSVDTVSVRVERAPAGARDARDANALAEALTANERAAVEALESFGVIGGVENGRSGTMAFELDRDASARVDAETGRTYYEFGYTTEVCRARIEEGAGGAKICVGPKGDLLESIKRRSRVVVTFVGDGDAMVVLKASAVSSRFDSVREIMDRAVDSFVVRV